MSRPARRLLTLSAAIVLAAACGQGSGGGGPSARSPQPSRGQAVTSPSPSTSVTPAGSVFVIVMENRTYAEAMDEPYTASLASQFAVATSYYAVSHPSLPNYLALTSGST